jgi:hypothetical protein
MLPPTRGKRQQKPHPPVVDRHGIRHLYQVGDIVWTRRLDWHRIWSAAHGWKIEGQANPLQIAKAREPHQCHHCANGIFAGQLYAVASGLRWAMRLCLNCVQDFEPERQTRESLEDIPEEPDMYAGMRCPKCKVVLWYCRCGRNGGAL